MAIKTDYSFSKTNYKYSSYKLDRTKNSDIFKIREYLPASNIPLFRRERRDLSLGFDFEGTANMYSVLIRT